MEIVEGENTWHVNPYLTEEVLGSASCDGLHAFFATWLLIPVYRMLCGKWSWLTREWCCSRNNTAEGADEKLRQQSDLFGKSTEPSSDWGVEIQAGQFGFKNQANGMNGSHHLFSADGLHHSLYSARFQREKKKACHSLNCLGFFHIILPCFVWNLSNSASSLLLLPALKNFLLLLFF